MYFLGPSATMLISFFEITLYIILNRLIRKLRKPANSSFNAFPQNGSFNISLNAARTLFLRTGCIPRMTDTISCGILSLRAILFKFVFWLNKSGALHPTAGSWSKALTCFCRFMPPASRVLMDYKWLQNLQSA